MPTYLVHGFRWPRAAIRIHVILLDLDDVSSDWIVAPASATTLLRSFYALYDFLPPSQPPIPNTIPTTSANPVEPPLPNAGNEILSRAAGASSTSRKGRANTHQETEGGKKAVSFNEWSVVKLLEAYDPEDETCVSQPYAYVADYITPVPLSLDIAAEMAAYEERQLIKTGASSPGTHSSDHGGKNGNASSSLVRRRMQSKEIDWLEQLRDKMAKEASIGWYVVVCGDVERTVPDFLPFSIDVGLSKKASTDNLRPKTPRSAGLRSFFGKKSRRPSLSADDED